VNVRDLLAMATQRLGGAAARLDAELLRSAKRSNGSSMRESAASRPRT
jgi:hypothetical protein